MSELTQKLIEKMNSVKTNNDLKVFLKDNLYNSDKNIMYTFLGDMNDFTRDLIGLGYLEDNSDTRSFLNDKIDGIYSEWDNYFFDVICNDDVKAEKYLKSEIFWVVAHDCVKIWDRNTGYETKVFVNFVHN